MKNDPPNEFSASECQRDGWFDLPGCRSLELRISHSINCAINVQLFNLCSKLFSETFFFLLPTSVCAFVMSGCCRFYDHTKDFRMWWQRKFSKAGCYLYIRLRSSPPLSFHHHSWTWLFKPLINGLCAAAQQASGYVLTCV